MACSNDARFDTANPLNKLHNEGKTLDIEHLNGVSSLLFTKCGPMVKHRDFIAFCQQSAQEAQHLLDQQWEKKTDVENLKQLVVEMQPRGDVQASDDMTTASCRRSPTSVIFGNPNPSARQIILLQLQIMQSTMIIEALDNFQHHRNDSHKM